MAVFGLAGTRSATGGAAVVEVLSYEKLVADFETKLVTQLRSFVAGAEFLETWVPDDDPVKSILNMVEAAEAYGRGDIAVRVSTGTLPGSRIDALRSTIGALGRLEAHPYEGDTLIVVSDIGQSR
jgi:3-hydroxyisobutyrate dehydrogenase-like beta-hydroxyacid dehydrogenase